MSYGGTAAQELGSVMGRLLEVRESAALTHLAAVELSALYGATGHSVRRVFPIAAARATAAPASEYAVALDSPEGTPAPAPIADDAELQACIESRRALLREGRVLVPLSLGDEVRHVVEVLGARVDGGAAIGAELVPLLTAYYARLAEGETDPLTRLATRRLFYSQTGAALARGSPGAARFLAVIDIDHFKSVNDRFGHLYGDEILIHFARLMRETFRASDSLFRFGGEEFLAVFTVPRAAERLRPLERFRAAVEAYAFPRVGRVTASIGLSAMANAITPVTTYVDRADRALYFAKEHGRNQVREYEALVADGTLTEAQAEGEATLF